MRRRSSGTLFHNPGICSTRTRAPRSARRTPGGGAAGTRRPCAPSPAHAGGFPPPGEGRRSAPATPAAAATAGEPGNIPQLCRCAQGAGYDKIPIPQKPRSCRGRGRRPAWPTRMAEDGTRQVHALGRRKPSVYERLWEMAGAAGPDRRSQNAQDRRESLHLLRKLLKNPANENGLVGTQPWRTTGSRTGVAATSSMSSLRCRPTSSRS